MLKLWNTKTRSLEEFKSIRPHHVGLYTCGPTVYNPVTIGNWRAFLFDDVLKRALRFLGYEVKHVLNITDVGHLAGDTNVGDDKIAREAARSGKTAWEIAKMYEKQFRDGMKQLGISTDKDDKLMVMPRATDHIKEQIDLVQRLEAAGFTYQTSDGVYFDTSKFKNYGSLSGQNLDEKEVGARIEVNPEKKHPADFALWKFSPKDRKRDMEWESPWGVGFPGWHIECSAMSVKYLGQPFDIHCGGVDHIAVHHENEIAQSEAIDGTPLSNFWLHNEFLLVDGRRMGKSEGNAYTIDDLVAKNFEPVSYRYFCLLAHYRTKINFTWEALTAAQNALHNLRKLVRDLPKKGDASWSKKADFIAALEDDLNTSQALAIMWDILHSDLPMSEKSAAVTDMDQVFGLGLADLIGKKIKIPTKVKTLADERLRVRQEKDWKRSDELRDELKELGWSVEDKVDGYDLRPMVQ